MRLYIEPRNKVDFCDQFQPQTSLVASDLGCALIGIFGVLRIPFGSGFFL
jgi:hypothetical protein